MRQSLECTDYRIMGCHLDDRGRSLLTCNAYLRIPGSPFAFPELQHPNFLMFLSILPLYTLLVVHKQNS